MQRMVDFYSVTKAVMAIFAYFDLYFDNLRGLKVPFAKCKLLSLFT
jgi:hypothetical protein